MPAARHTDALTLAVIGAGGALGAVARWAVQTGIARPPGAFPWATLAVNLVGCGLIGVLAARLGRATRAWAFLATGVLGGFTTFSAFAVDVDRLADAGRPLVAAGYVGLTLAGGTAAASAGRRA